MICHIIRYAPWQSGNIEKKPDKTTKSKDKTIHKQQIYQEETVGVNKHLTISTHIVYEGSAFFANSKMGWTTTTDNTTTDNIGEGKLTQNGKSAFSQSIRHMNIQINKGPGPHSQ